MTSQVKTGSSYSSSVIRDSEGNIISTSNTDAEGNTTAETFNQDVGDDTTGTTAAGTSVTSDEPVETPLPTEPTIGTAYSTKPTTDPLYSPDPLKTPTMSDATAAAKAGDAYTSAQILSQIVGKPTQTYETWYDSLDEASKEGVLLPVKYQQQEPTVTPVKTTDEGALTGLPTSTGLDTSYWHSFKGLSLEQQAEELNNPGSMQTGGYDENEAALQVKQELGWKPEWKAGIVNGALVPLKESTDITGSTEAVTNGTKWHTNALANRSLWSSDGYTTMSEIINDPNSNISRVRWVGDNDTNQKQQGTDYTATTKGEDTLGFNFAEHPDEVYIVHDKTVGWKTVKGSDLLRPHHDIAQVKGQQVEEEQDPLNTFLQGQVIDPSMPASAQQTYIKIMEKPEDFLTDADKTVAENLGISVEEAAKSKIISTAQGTYQEVDANDIESLQNLTASTYEDSVKTITDEEMLEALMTAHSGTVSKEVEAVTGEISEDAEAAKRDTLTEQEALAEEQAAITDVTMEAAEGEAGQIAPIRDVEGVTRVATIIDKTLEAEDPTKIQVGNVGDVEGIQTATTTADMADKVANDIDSNVTSIEKQISTIDEEIVGEAAHITDTEINKILDSTTPANYKATTGAITGGTASVVSGSDKVGEAVREITQGEAALDDLDDPKVIAAIAQMPIEALVSSQLETLLEPLENNEIPTWARPALEKVDAALAARGMGRSSIARDSLFNAIITAATPIAQSNAQALQLQANKNQDNQQRANELQANLIQDIRMANLTNEQSIRVENLRAMNQSQSEQFTFEVQQELKEYETLISFKLKNADYAQQMEQVNLNGDLQLELANLSAMNTADAANMTADNQLRLNKLQQYVNFVSGNEQFQQQMEMANLDMEGKVEFANLASKSQADIASMSFEEKKSLTEYQTKVANGQFNMQLAQALNFKNLDVTTNVALANMQVMNEAYKATFSADQNEAILEWQATVEADKFFEQLNTQVDLANLDMKGKVEFANLAALNEASRDQMTVDQQTALAEFQSRVEVGKYNAELAQQMGIANLSNKQQAATFNAQAELNIDLKTLDLNQQVELANSKFLQTMTATDLSNRQQAAILNATNVANMDITNATNAQKAQVENAQNFLQMDLTNLSNAQQAEMFNDQWRQQVLLSNQSVENAAKQFASQAENDINKFVASMQVNIEQTNAASHDTMQQFNTSESNKTDALNQGNDQAVNLYNAQMRESIAKFQEQVNFQRETFNASMGYQIDSSNVQWRRNMNTADTAGVNASNQANAINAFNLSSDAMNKMWQELRDTAQWEWQSSEGDAARKAQVALTLLGNENEKILTQMKIDGDDATSMGEGIANLMNGLFKGEYTETLSTIKSYIT